MYILKSLIKNKACIPILGSITSGGVIGAVVGAVVSGAAGKTVGIAIGGTIGGTLTGAVVTMLLSYEIFSTKIVEVIKKILLETLPASYKQEAKYYFYEEENKTNINDAFQYFLGGIEYRHRKAIYLASKNIENIVSRLRKLTAVKV